MSTAASSTMSSHHDDARIHSSNGSLDLVLNGSLDLQPHEEQYCQLDEVTPLPHAMALVRRLASGRSKDMAIKKLSRTQAKTKSVVSCASSKATDTPDAHTNAGFASALTGFAPALTGLASALTGDTRGMREARQIDDTRRSRVGGFYSPLDGVYSPFDESGRRYAEAQWAARYIQADAPMRPCTTPLPEETSIPGVIYGVLLLADMHAATPLGAWGRPVMSLDTAETHTT